MNNPKAYIVELAQSFPSIQNLVGTDPESWDAERLAKLKGLSTGERHALLFVLNVWNPAWARASKLHFDVVQAFGSWDSRHQHAFLAWAMNPRWP